MLYEAIASNQSPRKCLCISDKKCIAALVEAIMSLLPSYHQFLDKRYSRAVGGMNCQIPAAREGE